MQILKFFKNPQSHSSKWLFLYVWTPCEIGPQWLSYQACHIAIRRVWKAWKTSTPLGFALVQNFRNTKYMFRSSPNE